MQCRLRNLNKGHFGSVAFVLYLEAVLCNTSSAAVGVVWFTRLCPLVVASWVQSI